MAKAPPALTDIDIKLLRVFCTIVECGGFSQAQSELNLSRSTISTHMANLETRLGFQLCRRGRAGFAVTSRGRAVYESSRALLASMDGYYSQITQLREQIVGEVSVGVLDNIITHPGCRLYQSISNILQSSDGLRIIIRVAPPDQVEEQLVRGQIQMAIAPKVQALKTVSQKVLFSEQQHLFCGKDHPLFDAPDATITSQLIARQNYVRRGYVSVLTPYSSAFNHPAIAVSHQMEGLAHFILSGRCIGFLPANYADHWVERGEMRALRPKLFGFDVPICLLRDDHVQHSLAANHVYDAILNASEPHAANAGNVI